MALDNLKPRWNPEVPLPRGTRDYTDRVVSAYHRPVEAEMVYYQKGGTSYGIYKEYLWMKAGKRKTSDQLWANLLEFMTDYGETPVGIHDYRQIAIEIGWVFPGSEYEINMEQLDVLAVQVGHTLGMAQCKYAAEHGRLGSMSSDLLLRYGCISESWCEVPGFQPNKPPMLPLRTQARIRNSQYSTNVSAALPDNNNPAHFWSSHPDADHDGDNNPRSPANSV